MATLGHWQDPVFSGPYELAPLKSQYLLYHSAGALLTRVIGDAELANRLLVALAGAFMPLSFAALLRSLRRDPRLALFACLPFWSRSLVIGFLPFVTSIPMLFHALALVFRRRSRVLVGVIGVLLFYAHVSTWMIFVVIALVTGHRRMRIALVPSVVAAGIWILLGKLTLGEGTLADAGEVSRMRIGRALLAMPMWIFDVWQGHGDELAAALWWIGFLVVVFGSVRAVGRYSRRTLLFLYAPFACVLAAYLLTPWRVGAALMLNVRLAPILILFALLPTRLPRKGVTALALALAANVAGGIAAFAQCRASKTELGDLDHVLDAIPKGARLLTLSFDRNTAITHVYPWAHVGSYHRVRSGGVAGFSFSELHHWPIHYKPAEHPPVKPYATWDIDPCTFRNATDGPYYDFVLVRGPINPFAHEPRGPIFDPVVTTPPWTLYRKRAGEWLSDTDDGPCGH
jgi:hypothetical protein